MNKTARSRWITKLLGDLKLMKQYKAKSIDKVFEISDPIKRRSFNLYVKKRVLTLPFGLANIMSSVNSGWIRRRLYMRNQNIVYRILAKLGLHLDNSSIAKSVLLNAYKRLRKHRRKFSNIRRKYGDLLLETYEHPGGYTGYDPLLAKYRRYKELVDSYLDIVPIVKPDMAAKLEKPTGIDPLNTIWSKKHQHWLRDSYNTWLFGSPHYLVSAHYPLKGASNAMHPDLLLKIDPSKVLFQRDSLNNVLTTPHIGRIDPLDRLRAMADFKPSKVYYDYKAPYDNHNTYLALFRLNKSPLFLDISGVLPYIESGDSFYKAIIKRIRKDKISKLWDSIH